MNIVARTSHSALLASVAPALPFLAISLFVKGDNAPLMAALIAWSISAAHMIVLGIPAFLLLRRMRMANHWSLALAGFVLGFAPIALMSLADPSMGGSSNFFSFLVFGILGAFSALVFWFVWCSLGPNNSFNPMPLRGTG